MKEEVFVYKCPNCGGKVEFIDNKWHCNYCGNQYNALFNQGKNISLPNARKKIYSIFTHECSKCNASFVSSKEIDAECPFCGQVSNKAKQERKMFNILEINVKQETAQEAYNNELKSLDVFPNKKDFYKNLELEFINCDLYNGVIKLSYNKITEKYIFFNLLIPNIDYDDYRFLYEVGNIGIAYTIEASDNDVAPRRLDSCSKYIKKICDIDYLNDLVNECIDIFSQKYKITNKDQIKVDNNLDVSEGFYIPVYKCDVNVNNEVYHQYVFGNSSSNNVFRGSLFFNPSDYQNTIIELPTNNTDIGTCNRTRIISTITQKLFWVTLILAIIAGMFLFSLSTGSYYSNVYRGIQFGSLFVIVLFIANVIILVWSTRKYYYYQKTIRLTKKEYFNQIINNSNYVRRLKVKK